jgi:hypothetical protein
MPDRPRCGLSFVHFVISNGKHTENDIARAASRISAARDLFRKVHEALQAGSEGGDEGILSRVLGVSQEVRRFSPHGAMTFQRRSFRKQTIDYRARIRALHDDFEQEQQRYQQPAGTGFRIRGAASGTTNSAFNAPHANSRRPYEEPRERAHPGYSGHDGRGSYRGGGGGYSDYSRDREYAGPSHSGASGGPDRHRDDDPRAEREARARGDPRARRDYRR